MYNYIALDELAKDVEKRGCKNFLNSEHGSLIVNNEFIHRL
jgi:hypothetical protein